MIEETKRKIHFIPYTGGRGKEKDTSPAPTITLSRKYNSLSFSRAAILEMGMDNKFVRFYFEPIKKIIGWQIKPGVTQQDMKQWKIVKQKPNGGWQTNVKKLLDQFEGRLTKEVYKGLTVQKYREIGALSEYKNETFFFVELVDNPEELKKGLGNEKVRELQTA